MSFTKAVWTRQPDLLVMAIGDITAAAIRAGGVNPVVIGNGSLEGAMVALNDYLARQESR
jgi:uroporphyrinogen-III synthase